MDVKNMIEKITVNTQSSIRIECACGVVYLDPLQISGEPHDADYILVTHNHGDHFSPEDIKRIAKPDSVFIAPQKMEDQAKELQSFVGSVETVVSGEHRIIKDLKLETVPAYNNLKPFHPKKAGWVGYILISEGKRIYVAGDTDLTKDNQTVRCDIAMVPIGGTYTMDAKKAAELINEIKPQAVIPTHYGTIVGKAADADSFASLVAPEIPVERKLVF